MERDHAPRGGPALPGAVQQFEVLAVVGKQDAVALGGDQQLLVVVCSLGAQFRRVEHIMPLGA